MRRILSHWAGCGLLLMISGCAAPTPSAPKPAMRALGQSASVEASQSDETIGAEIRRRLQFADPAASAGVVVEVDGGIITLRGVAADVAAAWRMEAIARAVPGAKQVVNRLLVQQTAP